MIPEYHMASEETVCVRVATLNGEGPYQEMILYRPAELEPFLEVVMGR